MGWEHYIDNVYGEPDGSTYMDSSRSRVVKSVKIGAKSNANRRLSQSRAEASRAPKYETIQLADLIQAGLLPAGSTFLNTSSDRIRAATHEFRIGAELRKIKTSAAQAALDAEIAWELEVSHKNRDSTPSGKSRRNRK